MRPLPLLALAACAPEVDPRCLVGDPALHLGTGEDRYRSLDEADDLEVVFGPQGGYHAVYAIRPSGVEARVAVRVRVEDLDSGRRLTDETVSITLSDGPGRCALEAWNLYAHLDIVSAKDVVGHQAELLVTVTDKADRVAQGEIIVSMVDRVRE